MNRLLRIVGLVVAATAAAASLAQVSLPGVPLPRLPPVTEPVTGTLRTATSTLADVRRLRVRELLRSERATVESDPDGQPILRRQVGALSPTPAALERARAEGFTVLRTESLEALGLTLVVLQAPDGLSTRRALKKLRELDPEGQYDYNHLYLGSGLPAESEALQADDARGAAAGTGERPAHRTDRQRRRCNASGTRRRKDREAGLRRQGISRAARHRRRLAPGRQGRQIRGRHPGRDPVRRRHFLRSWRRLDEPAGDRSSTGWHARRWPVVNISLVGAKSILLTGLVRAMTSRGFLLVAAVGNDGPTAPPLFPAAYPDVVGVTGVDAKHRVLPEALPRRAGGFRGAGGRPRCRRGWRRFQRDSRHVIRDADRGGPACRIAAVAGCRKARERRCRRSNRLPWISAITASTRLMVKAWSAQHCIPAEGKKPSLPGVLAGENRGMAAGSQEQVHENS